MWDFLFKLTEYSNNEGKQILVECDTLNEAYHILGQNGFELEEYDFVDRMSIKEGDILDLDTYIKRGE